MASNLQNYGFDSLSGRALKQIYSQAHVAFSVSEWQHYVMRRALLWKDAE